MVAPLIAASLASAQLPPKASVMYTGIPFAAENSRVRMVTHDARGTLTKDMISVSSLTYFKNSTGDTITVHLNIPVRGQNVNWNMPRNTSVSAQWDNHPLAVTAKTPVMTEVSDTQQKNSGVMAEHYANNYVADVTFKPGEAHSLRVFFSAPIGHAGLDGVQRTLAYDTSGASSWNGPIDQFNFSLSYTPRVVFQIFAALPPNSWETSSTGAFWKKLSFVPEDKPLLLFTYYPGGFDKLGGG